MATYGDETVNHKHTLAQRLRSGVRYTVYGTRYTVYGSIWYYGAIDLIWFILRCNLQRVIVMPYTVYRIPYTVPYTGHRTPYTVTVYRTPYTV